MATWKPFIKIDDINEYTHYVVINGERYYIPRQFDLTLDIENKRYSIDKVKGYKTINQLNAEGTNIEFKYPYLTIETPIYNKFDIDDVILFFKKRGFNVSEKAIKHNYNAWKNDFKSGYRDEKNNYHLFTSCGCNPLSFTLTTLHKTAIHWQSTYEV